MSTIPKPVRHGGVPTLPQVLIWRMLAICEAAMRQPAPVVKPVMMGSLIRSTMKPRFRSPY